MEYYLQVLLGLIVLVALVVPMSTNIKAISIKNIIAAIIVMFIFNPPKLHSPLRGASRQQLGPTQPPRIFAQEASPVANHVHES